LPANILIILPATWVLYLGVVVLLMPYGIIHSWFSWVLENLVVLMNKTLLVFEQLPYAVLSGIWIQSWQYLLLYCLLFVIFSFFIYRKRMNVYILIVCIIVLLGNRAVEVIQNQYLNEIRFYNVYTNLAVGFFDHATNTVLTDS